MTSNPHSAGPDDYITPLPLIEALGPFTTDPCCHPWMPWRTAGTMHSLHPEAWADANVYEDKATGQRVRPPPPLQPPSDTRFVVFDYNRTVAEYYKPTWGDGLQAEWKGFTWLNHPYSNGLPWAKRMVEHNDGIMLCTPKAVDTAWFQLCLSACTRIYLMAGRLLFHLPTGERTKGKWLPNCLMSFGEQGTQRLEWFARGGDGPHPYPGRLMRGCGP